MMRKVTASLVIILAGLASGCYEKSDGKDAGAAGPLYRHHFVGMAQIANSTNATKLKEVWALKASADLRAQVLDKLAGAPRTFWRQQLPATAPDQKELVRPLVEDMVSAESLLEIRGPASRAEGVLAIRLSPERARLWHTNLWKLTLGWKAGTPEPLQVGASKGWGFKRKDDGAVVQMLFAGDWILVGVGRDQLTLLPPFLEQAAKTGRPVPALANNSLLEMDADLPRLKAWFPFLAKAKMPPAHLTLLGRGEYVRTEMRWRYSEKIPWKFEPWKIPAGVINEPLTSFAVGQGIAPLLGDVPGVSQLGLKSMPNQFCAWSLPMHFMTFVAAPMPNASNVVKQIAPRMPTAIKAHFPDMAGEVAFLTNVNQVIWTGLPIATPFLRAVRDGGADFLLGGTFPVFSKTNSPPPAELLGQFMGRTNLIYYHWEITEKSLLHDRPLVQVVDILQHRVLPGTNTPSVKWVLDVAPHLGNAITEVTQTAPNELSLTRKSHIGLTGFELLMLTRWFDSPTFPFQYEPPRKISARSSGKSNSPKTNSPKTNVPAPKTR